MTYNVFGGTLNPAVSYYLGSVDTVPLKRKLLSVVEVFVPRYTYAVPSER